MRVFIISLMLFYSQITFAVNSADQKVIPSLTNEPIGVGNYLQMFFGLFLVVALIFGMAWFMRRMGSMNGNAAENLKVLGGVSVGQRERVVLVQAGETQLLIGVAPGSVRALHVMDEPILTPSTTAKNPTSGFAEKLHAAIKNRSNT